MKATTTTFDETKHILGNGKRRPLSDPVNRPPVNVGGIVDNDRRTQGDRREQPTVPELAARNTKGIVAVTQRFAANMTLGTFLLVIVIAVGGTGVAFWSPLFHDSEPRVTPTVERQKRSEREQDQISDLERKQDHDAMVNDMRYGKLEKDVTEIKQTVTENQVFMVDVRQFMAIVYTGLGIVGSMMAGVLVGILVLLAQRWLKIKV